MYEVEKFILKESSKLFIDGKVTSSRQSNSITFVFDAPKDISVIYLSTTDGSTATVKVLNTHGEKQELEVIKRLSSYNREQIQ